MRVEKNIISPKLLKTIVVKVEVADVYFDWQTGASYSIKMCIFAVFLPFLHQHDIKINQFGWKQSYKSPESRVALELQQGCTKCGGTSPCQRSWHRKKFQRKADKKSIIWKKTQKLIPLKPFTNNALQWYLCLFLCFFLCFFLSFSNSFQFPFR